MKALYILLVSLLSIGGAFKYSAKKDLVRVEVPVQKTEQELETLAMVFEKSTGGANLIIAWENNKVSLPVLF